MSIRGFDQGFTLVELVVAMALFSFMLLIVVVGFMNIVGLHDQAIAANATQNSARAALDQLVDAVRNSQSVQSICDSTGGNCGSPKTATEILCLNMAASAQEVFYVDNGVLYEAQNCPAAQRVSVQALTEPSVQVTNFGAVVQSVGASITKPEVQLSVTVASANGTSQTAGQGAAATTTCANDDNDRQYCSVITLTSGAEPR